MHDPTHHQTDPSDPPGCPSPSPSSSSSPSPYPPDFSSASTTLPASGANPTYTNPAHRALASYLNTAIATRILGASPPEHDESEFTPLRRFITSFPTHLILFQLIWSAIVSALAYALVRGGDNPWSTLSTQFWPSQLLLTPSVVSGVGWALFVLLGFFIREAAQRYDEALRHWGNIAALLRQTVRQVVQAYPPGVWHEGDHDRLVAHLIAYPLALKMTLRGESDRGPLEKVLHPDDVEDVVNADSMHVQCIRVVRAYLSSAEVDGSKPFLPQKRRKEKGFCPRYFAVDQVDEVEIEGNALERIARFQSAVGYTFHLKIFLYIWLLFLPLGIIGTSGWFTPLWSGLITYGVGMLFQIAMHLNEPFGFDLEDIKLNRIAAETALGTLNAFACTRMTVADVVRESPQRSWIKKKSDVSPSASSLESDEAGREWETGKMKSQRKRNSVPIMGWAISFLKNSRFKVEVAVPMTIFAIWLTVVVFLSWGLAEFVVTTDPAQCVNARWWCLYVPLNPRTTRYIGLGVFLLLGFWINDAYGRYRRGLFLWKVDLQRSLEQVALLFCMVFKRGSWHEEDRERLLSHIAALPYTCKLKLRDCRDLDELTGILSEEDLQALERASVGKGIKEG